MRYRGGGIGHYRVPLPIDDFDNDALLPPEAADGLSIVYEGPVFTTEKKPDLTGLTTDHNRTAVAVVHIWPDATAVRLHIIRRVQPIKNRL